MSKDCPGFYSIGTALIATGILEFEGAVIQFSGIGFRLKYEIKKKTDNAIKNLKDSNIRKLMYVPFQQSSEGIQVYVFFKNITVLHLKYFLNDDSSFIK